MTIAFATRKALAPQIAKMTGTRLLMASAFLNWIAAAGAGGLNCTLMRQKELVEGVDVEDESGKIVYGKSVVAGQQAIF